MRKNRDEDHTEQEESQQTEKGERNRKGQPKLQQVEKRGGRTEPRNRSHRVWKKKTLRKTTRSSPNRSMRKSEDQRAKKRWSHNWNRRKGKPHKISETQKILGEQEEASIPE